MLRGKGDTCMKANSFRGLDKRRFFRAECRLNTEFQILEPAFDGLWDPLRGAISADVLDLSVAGMKIRFTPPSWADPSDGSGFEWADCAFRFLLKGSYLVLPGHMLRIYEREGSTCVTGVEFFPLPPDEQFRIVELFAEFRRRLAAKG